VVFKKIASINKLLIINLLISEQKENIGKKEEIFSRLSILSNCVEGEITLIVLIDQSGQIWEITPFVFQNCELKWIIFFCSFFLKFISKLKKNFCYYKL
jgi:hypothetical protein